jgi:hypothetical protein
MRGGWGKDVVEKERSELPRYSFGVEDTLCV